MIKGVCNCRLVGCPMQMSEDSAGVPDPGIVDLQNGGCMERSSPGMANPWNGGLKSELPPVPPTHRTLSQ